MENKSPNLKNAIGKRPSMEHTAAAFKSRIPSWSGALAVRTSRAELVATTSASETVLDSFPVPPSPVIAPRSVGIPRPSPPSPLPNDQSASPPPQDADTVLLCDNLPCPKLASLICANCNEAPKLTTDPQVAQYCSEECQNSHAAQHASHCERLVDRNKLFRCMGIAHKAFLVYREMSWHAFEIRDAGITADESMIMLKGHRTAEEDWPDCFRPFPHELVPGAHEKMALLSFMAQGEANLWASEFIHGFLSDAVALVETVVHQVKRVPCKVVLDESEDSDSSSDSNKTVTENEARDKKEIAERKLIWEDRECEVLKITMNTGEEYAVTLAGAQYGFYEDPVIDWGEYERNCIVPSSVTYAHPPFVSSLITASDYRVSQKIQLYYTILSDKTSKDLLSRHLETLNLYFMEWQFDGQMPLEKMWGLPLRQWAFRERNLLDYVEWKFCRYCKPNLTGRGRAMSRALRLKHDQWDYKTNFDPDIGDDLRDLVSAIGFPTKDQGQPLTT